MTNTGCPSDLVEAREATQEEIKTKSNTSDRLKKRCERLNAGSRKSRNSKKPN